jgi:hypothetical protein
MFAPAHADRNQWSTEGVGHDEQDLHDALRRALLYYDDTREDVPPTTKFHERWMGQKDGEWYICDEAGYIVSDGPLHGSHINGYAPTAITVATLVPEPEPEPDPEPEPEPEPVVEEPEPDVYDEIADTRRRLHAASDGLSIEDGRWDDTANLHQLAGPFGNAAIAADLIRRGDIGRDDVARPILRQALLEVAAVATGWVETIDRA